MTLGKLLNLSVSHFLCLWMRYHNSITSQGDCEHYIELICKAVISSTKPGMTWSLAWVLGIESFLELENKRCGVGGAGRTQRWWSPFGICWIWGVRNERRWSFQTVMLEKTLDRLLDSKEIKLVNLKGNQPWIFTGRTVAEVEAPILWPPNEKSELIRKDPDDGQDRR